MPALSMTLPTDEPAKIGWDALISNSGYINSIYLPIKETASSPGFAPLTLGGSSLSFITLTIMNWLPVSFFMKSRKTVLVSSFIFELSD